MSNLAFGVVSITGTKQNILSFAQRFIYENEEDVKYGYNIPYFACSVAETTRSAAIEKVNTLFSNSPDETESTFTLYVNFSWSAHDCLINGFPREDAECCSLMDACRTDGVSVGIKAEEPTGGTEEEIYCNKDGVYESRFDDMETFICTRCGDSRCLPSYVNADECECDECGNRGYKLEEDENDEEDES